MKYLAKLDNLGKSIGKLIPDWLIAVAARVSIFMIFWPSAQTKIDGLNILGQKFAFWGVTDSTIMLFEYEYALPLIPPELAAYLATIGEFFLSIFVLLGFFTRFSALGLLVMTLVIQIFVYPGAWVTHLLWATLLIYLLRNGAGNVSLDKMI